MTSIGVFRGTILQATAATNTDFEANVADDGTDLTQYITLDPATVISGRLMYVIIYLDSANNRSFDLVLANGTHATNNTQMAKYIFQSDEYASVGDQGIADATTETFELDRPFRLDRAGRMYHTLYSSAGAFGQTQLGRLKVSGIFYQ